MKFTKAARELRGVIYTVTHDESGRQYVSQTKGTAFERFAGHKCATLAGENHPLYAAIRKHGSDAFTVDVVDSCLFDELDLQEKFWIQKLKALHPKGYNLTDGGQKARRVMLARQNMSVAKRGRIVSEETRKRISDAQKGKPKPALSQALKGRKLSLEHRVAISRGLIGTHTGPRSAEVRAKISASLIARNQQPACDNRQKPIWNDRWAMSETI